MNEKGFSKSGDCVISLTTGKIYVEIERHNILIKEAKKEVFDDIEPLMMAEEYSVGEYMSIKAEHLKEAKE